MKTELRNLIVLATICGFLGVAAYNVINHEHEHGALRDRICGLEVENKRHFPAPLYASLSETDLVSLMEDAGWKEWKEVDIYPGTKYLYFSKNHESRSYCVRESK